MKAAIAPAPNASWVVKDIPTPRPGPNEVLIKIHASGLCFTDIHQTRGQLPGPFPRTLGHEPVGEIVEVGPGVRTRKVGDRVGVPWVQTTCGRCEWCRRRKPMFCAEYVGTGMQVPGGHAEYMPAAADATMLLPDGRFVLMGFEAKPLGIQPGDLIMRRIRILGSQQNGPEYLHEALDFVARGKVKVMLETFPLDEINRAYERVEKGRVRFRAVVTP